jgi:hypothetical protein
MKGSILFNLGEDHREIKEGERFDVPPQTEHKAIVGETGAEYIVAAMLERDS